MLLIAHLSKCTSSRTPSIVHMRTPRSIGPRLCGELPRNLISRTSWNSVKRKSNFGEFTFHALRRITRVRHFLRQKFIADSSLRASMHKSAQRCSVEPVWKGGCRGCLPEQLRNCLTRFRDKLCHLRDLLRLTDQFDRVEEAYAQAPLT